MNGGAEILGLGTAVPAGRIVQTTASRLAVERCFGTERERAWLRRIYRASGVRERASVLLGAGGDTAPLEAFYPAPAGPDDRGPTTAARLARYTGKAVALGARACNAAFADGDVEPARVTHLITVSCTGLFSPGLAEMLIAELGLPPDVGRLNLGFMGCHGALNGMRAAEAFVEADANACVLLCCVELCTLHFQYGRDPQQMVANALFADGAGAAILGRGDRSGLHLEYCASRIMPDSRREMTWVIGDHGFEMGLSPRVPELIRDELRAWLEAWLNARGVGFDDIAHWAIHPGGPKIVQSAATALGLPASVTAASLAVLAEHGNMSSPTVLFVIERLRATKARGLCVALGFGPGLAFEAALLEFR